MRFIIADTFTKSLEKLDQQSSSLIKQAAFDFQMNPANPGFKFHKLERAKDKRFWSFRVTDDLRVIVHRTEETFMLCFAGHHDEAYDWAENRKVTVHPSTGAAQIVEVIEKQEEVVKRVIKPVEEEPPLFKKYDPAYLLALGVPEEWLDAVKHAGETAFEKMLDKLPQEAAERLMELACGNPVPRPVAVSGDPYSHPDARRRFLILSDQEELRRALEAPWERWLVFLHPTQREVVEKNFNGPARVSGSAGTGKTVVALHRAAHLARTNPQAKILLTSFSKTLATRLAQHADLLIGPDTRARQQVEVAHLHQVARSIWWKRTHQNFNAVGNDKLVELIKNAAQQTGGQGFSPAFLRSEWETIIDSHHVVTWEEYQKISRAGRGTPLGTKARFALWKIFESVWQALRDEGLMTWNQLCHEVAAILEQEPNKLFDFVVADEVQDFGPAEFRLLRALAKEGENDLFLCGDSGQRIYKTHFSLTAAGINTRGRAIRLKLNYRTTEQVKRFADKILPETIQEIDDAIEPRATVSLLSGPPPEVKTFATEAEEVVGIANWLTPLLHGGYQPQDIAVLARTNTVLKNRAEPALRRCGVSWHYLSDEQPPSTSEVALGTMHRAKGLEFKIVVIAGCDASLLPLSSVLVTLADNEDRKAFIEQEKHLLYVACTRARERLLVTCTGKPSELLG